MSNSELAKQAKAEGNAFFSSKEWDKAIEKYTKAIELDPNGAISHTFYSNRSACYAGKADYDNALKDGKKCVELKPDFVKGYSRVGLAHFKLGDLDAAQKAYEDGLKVDGNNASLKSGLEETKRAKEQQIGGGGAGGGAGAGGQKGLFGPEIWMQIHSHPELRQYANDQDFIQKVKMLQTNPQMAMQMGLLNDEKIKKLFEVMLGARFGGPAGGDEEKNDNNANNNNNNDDNYNKEFDVPLNDNNKNKNKNDSSNNKQDSKDNSDSKEEEKKMEELTEEEKEELKKIEEAKEVKLKGNKLYKDQKFEEALIEYRKAASLDPTQPSYALNQSAVLFMQEKWDECIKMCEEAIKINEIHFRGEQWSFKAYHRMGNVEEKRGNFIKAITYYKKGLIEKHDKNLRKHVTDLERYLKKKEEKEYIDPNKAVQHKSEGNRLFKEGKYGEAINEYTEAIKRNPNDHILYSNRANAFCKLMRWDAALEDCDKALKIDSKFIKAWIRKGKIQHVLKQYHKALECFQKAEEIDATVHDLIMAKRDTMIAIQERNSKGQVDEKARQQALQDPKVRAAMNDPEVSSVLLQAQSGDPTILMKAMRDRPHIAKKIETLIAAGVLQVK